MNHLVFAKNMENVHKHRSVKVVNNGERRN